MRNYAELWRDLSNQSEALLLLLFSDDDEPLTDGPVLSEDPVLSEEPDEAVALEEPLVPFPADSPLGLSLELSPGLSPAASFDLLPERA